AGPRAAAAGAARGPGVRRAPGGGRDGGGDAVVRSARRAPPAPRDRIPLPLSCPGAGAAAPAGLSRAGRSRRQSGAPRPPDSPPSPGGPSGRRPCPASRIPPSAFSRFPEVERDPAGAARAPALDAGQRASLLGVGGDGMLRGWLPERDERSGLADGRA